MGMTDAFVQEIDNEAATTRRVLERVPADRLSWKPHPKSMSLGELAMHVAQVPGTISSWAVEDTFNFGTLSHNQAGPTSTEQVLKAHDEGLTKAKDLLAYLSNANTISFAKIERIADKVLAKNGVRVRPINMKDFQGDVERVWEVYGAAWANNWGFIPMSREEFFQMGKEMKMILKPELVLIGEVGSKVVGFALALPDVNQALKHAGGSLFPTGLVKILYYQRLIRNVRVLALGVVEEYRTSGLAAGFYATLVRNARKLGFGDCEMSWILEDNVLMNRSLEAMGAKRYKTYRIYEWN